MMPRKKRRVILITSIVTIIVLMIGILIFLAINTDMFYSKQTLFSKYLSQNFSKMQSFTQLPETQIEKLLETNQYTSELTAQIEYTQNRNTSAQNDSNSINGAQLKIQGQVDKQNQYEYRDFRLTKQDKDLLKMEYLKQEDRYGVRLHGIKQFASVQENNLEDLEKKMNLSEGTISGLLSICEGKQIEDFKNIFEFSEQEINTIQNTYIGIVGQMLEQQNYQKQTNGTITLKGQEQKVNSYFITLTKEEYNNILIKLLEKMTEDEILLNRVDQLQILVEQLGVPLEDHELRNEWSKKIKAQITEIQNTNIGQDTVKITVYEKNRATIRTLIEIPNEQMKIDFYEQGIQFSKVILRNNQQIEKRFVIEKQQQEDWEKYFISYEELADEEIVKNQQMQIEKKLQNSQIANTITIQFLTEDSKAILTINENIKLVNNLDNKIEFDEKNSVVLNELDTDRVNAILSILQKNMQNQQKRMEELVKIEDITNMLKNIGILQADAIKIEETGGVTESEKNRFNSKFEFFVGDNLKAEHIEQLIEVAKEHLDSVDVISPNEINLKLKRDHRNEELAASISEIIEKNKNKQYTVSMNYQEETGLIESITIKINEKK